MSRTCIATATTSLVLLGLLSGCGGATNNVNVQSDGTVNVNTSEGTAKIGAQSMPENWPSDIPAYPGATVSYSTAVNPQNGKPGMAVALMTKDDAKTVTEYYKKELAGNGWTVDSVLGGAGTSIFSARKAGSMASFLIQGDKDQTTITMAIETGAQQ